MTTAEAPAKEPTKAEKKAAAKAATEAAKAEAAAKAATDAAAATEPVKEVKPGMATRQPNLATATQQPKGRKPTKAEVKKARQEWGVTPYFEGDYIAVRPGSGKGVIVHAAEKANSEMTLCRTPMTWAQGVKVVDQGDFNCLWCMTRITSF